MKPQLICPAPEDTARVAHAAYPKGNVYMQMRDALGTIYEDQIFAHLFPECGQPAEAPWRLALVTIMQFAEGLTDRQAADAVRGRIDWKYTLGLELTDPGFDASVLSEFRTRLVKGQGEQLLLDAMLTVFKERGWLKAGGRQRTDSTHVLAKIRALNRLLCVGETIRYALNSLALVAPSWLREHSHPDWIDRYGHRVEEGSFPRGTFERRAEALTIGHDGTQLLDAIYASSSPAWLREVPAVNILRQVWLQNFVVIEGVFQWRENENIPPPARFIASPYDLEAHYAREAQHHLDWL